MTVWIFESNLMWSSRFINSVRGLGHQGLVATEVPEGSADVAIVNLSDPKVAEVTSKLAEKGIYIIAHAGHKEKDLIALGKQIPVDRVATNGEITKKLDVLLRDAEARKS